MATRAFKSHGAMVWFQILGCIALLVAGPIAAWQSTEDQFLDVVVPLLMFVGGALGLWHVLGTPRTIAVDDDGFLQIHSFRGMERLHATEIVEIRQSSTNILVKLRKGNRQWSRNYDGLHELLTLLKKHNPDIRLPGL